jgi:hypothetical protein
MQAGLRRNVEIHRTGLGRPPPSEVKLEKVRSALVAGKVILTKVPEVRNGMTATVAAA